MNGFELLSRPFRGLITAWEAERWLRVTLLVLYLIMIFSLSAVPGTSIPVVADDRIEHSVEYFGLELLVLLVVAGFQKRAPSRIALMSAVAFAVLYGATDEFHQRFVPFRDSSLKDLCFDAIGASVAALTIGFLTSRSERSA